MNRLEANVSLFVITFFAAIQYVFIKNIPSSVSHFAYLTLTNLIGFGLTFIVFFGELFRLDRKQIIQSMMLSVELFGFNLFLLLGSSGVQPTVSACVLSAYFMFVPLLTFILFKQKPVKNVIIAVAVVLLGLLLFMELDVGGLLNISVLYLVAADVVFAAYIITTERLTVRSNPSILAMGQLFFNCIFAGIAWLIQSLVTGNPVQIPHESAFWGSVLFISFFIRGMYGVVQIYAQRYVSAFNTSLIFSTEIIMTMLMSPVMAKLFGAEKESITVLKVLGCLLIVAGLLVADPSFNERLKRSSKGKVKNAGKS